MLMPSGRAGAPRGPPVGHPTVAAVPHLRNGFVALAMGLNPGREVRLEGLISLHAGKAGQSRRSGSPAFGHVRTSTHPLFRCRN